MKIWYFRGCRQLFQLHTQVINYYTKYHLSFSRDKLAWSRDILVMRNGGFYFFLRRTEWNFDVCTERPCQCRKIMLICYKIFSSLCSFNQVDLQNLMDRRREKRSHQSKFVKQLCYYSIVVSLQIRCLSRLYFLV